MGADSDKTLHNREEGEGEDWGLAVMRQYILGKRVRERTGGWQL
jgi:hypothetical protein